MPTATLPRIEPEGADTATMCPRTLMAGSRPAMTWGTLSAPGGGEADGGLGLRRYSNVLVLRRDVVQRLGRVLLDLEHADGAIGEVAILCDAKRFTSCGTRSSAVTAPGNAIACGAPKFPLPSPDIM